jgi:hypothetical protein
MKKFQVLLCYFSYDAEGWARIDLTRHAGRELGRGLTHLTISGLVPSTQTNTGFADVKMVSKDCSRFGITVLQVSKDSWKSMKMSSSKKIDL